MWKSVATLTSNRGYRDSERGDGAREANVHAQDARSPWLYFELRLRQREIAERHVSQSTVHEYVERFRAAGLSWPLPAESPNRAWKRGYFPTTPACPGRPSDAT